MEQIFDQLLSSIYNLEDSRKALQEKDNYRAEICIYSALTQIQCVYTMLQMQQNSNNSFSLWKW